jgi:hypothetical protein
MGEVVNILDNLSLSLRHVDDLSVQQQLMAS